MYIRLGWMDGWIHFHFKDPFYLIHTSHHGTFLVSILNLFWDKHKDPSVLDLTGLGLVKPNHLIFPACVKFCLIFILIQVSNMYAYKS
jgi:hypothetical protein